jgi:hypothetical protein
LTKTDVEAASPGTERRRLFIGPLPAKGDNADAAGKYHQHFRTTRRPANDGLDVPDFLKLSAADRRRAWERHPSKPTPALGREVTSTEVAYRASIEREKAAKRAADEVRFQAMRAKAAAEKSEREAIKQAVEREAKFAHPGRNRGGAAGRRRKRSRRGQRRPRMATT